MTAMRKEFFCPTDDWDCPYCEKDGLCALGASATKECDEAAFFFEDEDGEDEEADYEEEMGDLDMGFDPYMGCYTDDC